MTTEVQGELLRAVKIHSEFSWKWSGNYLKVLKWISCHFVFEWANEIHCVILVTSSRFWPSKTVYKTSLFGTLQKENRLSQPERHINAVYIFIISGLHSHKYCKGKLDGINSVISLHLKERSGAWVWTASWVVCNRINWQI